MKQKNIIMLEIDAQQIEMSIEKLLAAFGKLNILAKEISASKTGDGSAS